MLFTISLPLYFSGQDACAHTSIRNRNHSVFSLILSKGVIHLTTTNIDFLIAITLGLMRLVTTACEFHFFLNEMHVQMAIQMFPSNKTYLAVGATMLRQLPGTQSPTDLTKIFPCTALQT